MRWNKREILAEEQGRALYNENQLDVFTHKPNCLSELYEMFGEKKRIRKHYIGTYLLYFLKLFSLTSHFSNILFAIRVRCNHFTAEDVQCCLVRFMIDQLRFLLANRDG